MARRLPAIVEEYWRGNGSAPIGGSRADLLVTVVTAVRFVDASLAENVGGGRHNYDMSAIHITGADTCPVLGPWFLTKAPLVYVGPQLTCGE
jgi:hypothetical protein